MLNFNGKLSANDGYSRKLSWASENGKILTGHVN